MKRITLEATEFGGDISKYVVETSCNEITIDYYIRLMAQVLLVSGFTPKTIADHLNVDGYGFDTDEIEDITDVY